MTASILKQKNNAYLIRQYNMQIFRVSQVTEQYLSVKWWKIKATCPLVTVVSLCPVYEKMLNTGPKKSWKISMLCYHTKHSF